MELNCVVLQRVSKANWANRGRHRTAQDVFTVRQSGRRVTVTRVDRAGRNGHGWGMNLKFRCIKKATSRGRRRRGRKTQQGTRRIRMQNGWKSYGRGYRKPSTTKYGNLCVVSGLIKRRGIKNPLTTLRKDCRPNKRLIFNLNNHWNTIRVDVFKNGQVRYVAGTLKLGWLNLDGIQFATKNRRSVALRNGWKAYGGSYGTPTYTKTGSVCEVEGLIKGIKWGATMVQLPSNCRPKKRLIFNLNNHKKTARVDVLRNGQVRWIRGGKDHGWISLGGIVFSTARGVALRTINGWRSYGGAYGKLTVEKTATLCLVSGLLKGSRWGRPMAKLPKDVDQTGHHVPGTLHALPMATNARRVQRPKIHCHQRRRPAVVDRGLAVTVAIRLQVDVIHGDIRRASVLLVRRCGAP